MGRIKKWWWLVVVILAIACVIGWKEKRCQAQADQCRAAYEAQAQSESVGAPRLTVDQQASEQQAIAAACEPNGYFCPLFSPTNLPTMLLVIIGALGIVAALKTLWAIERQADTLERQTKATEDTAEAALVAAKANRPWILMQVNDKYPQIGRPTLPMPQEGKVCFAEYRLRNFGNTPARILEQKVRLYIGKSWNSVPDVEAFETKDSVKEDYAFAQSSEHLFEAPLEPWISISQEDRDAILSGSRFLWLCGFVKYESASETEPKTTPYESRICYLWIREVDGKPSFWVMRGPRQYNRAT